MGRWGSLIGVVGAALACLVAASGAAAQLGASYTVPKDNPFAKQSAAGEGEIWASGLRNPWRFSFDRETGDLVIGDVGQSAIEEVNFAAAGTGRGANYGWNCFEGSEPFVNAPPGCEAPGHVPPVFEYENDAVNCSLTGGYVVRDDDLPIAGRYLYADFCAGELRTVELFPDGSRDDRSVGLRVPTPSSFGEDSAGRIYVASLAGPVFRLIAGVGPVEVLPLPVGVFASPVYVASEPDDPGRLFVVEQDGTVQLVDGVGPPTTFLDISGDVGSSGLEQGLLSVAFAPDYETSGLLYVYFTDLNGDIRIEELRRSESDPDVADPDSRRLVLTVEHRDFQNHNGGQLQFGPDGFLYAGLGDGGGAGDPLGNGQNLDTLLGSLIRIDPREPSAATAKAKGPKAKGPRR